MKRLVTLTFCLLISHALMAQKEAYNWNFGIGLRLDFSSGQPVFATGGNTYAPEGSASYSDKNGNLMFYTSGDTFIYNANDQVMFNMGNSGGNYSAEQSSVIIEVPCDSGKYYLFTMDGFDPTSSNNGLNYFKIDMSLNGGLGGVVQPGVNLYSNSLEGLCAIRARNRTDYFILINHNTIGLGVYKVTSSGISLHSVFNYPPFGTKRLIKASPDGSKVFVFSDPDGSSSGVSSTFGLLLDFDNTTGTLSNPQSLSSVFYANPGSSCIGFNYFEFSPNSRYLYLATCNTIQRFDLQNGQTVANVIFDFYNWTGSAWISQLQLGPDGNIYFCFWGQLISTGQVVTELSRIRCPNNSTPVVERILPVPNSNVFLAMPNYPAWLFEAYDSTYVSLGPDTVFLCDNNGSISLDALNPGASYQWSNGSTAQTTTVSGPGTYTVAVNGPCGIGRDTIVVLNCYGEILANYYPCSLDSIPFSLYSNELVNSITWDFGDPGSGSNNVASGGNTIHTFSQDGTYTITAVMNTTCSVDTFTKTITIYDAIPPTLDIVSCASYIAPWGVTYTQSGTYFDYVDSLSNECDSLIQVNVTITGLPSVIVSTVSGNCGQANGTATATALGGAGNYEYNWSNGATGSSITGLSAGSYSVIATDQNGCSATSQVIVSTTPAAGVTLTASDTILGLNETATLEIVGGDTYNWSPATGLNCTDCASVIATPQSSTTYTVTGTDSIGCPYIRLVNVVVDIICGELFVPNIFSPNGIGNPENEKLCVYSNCIKSMNFGIYNRWGELIFSTDNQNDCWDGTHKGVPVTTGVYSYRLFLEQFDGERIERAGNITLTR
jgi:gliding motility-associated-like protein